MVNIPLENKEADMATKPSGVEIKSTMLEAIRKTAAAERKAVEKVIAAVKKAEEAKADAKVKVFAAKAIAHLAKEAGIKGPPDSVKAAAIAGAREKAEAAKEKAAAAKEKAEATVAAARAKAAEARARAEAAVGS